MLHSAVMRTLRSAAPELQRVLKVFVKARAARRAAAAMLFSDFIAKFRLLKSKKTRRHVSGMIACC